jgi:hypothetical protein
LKLEDIKVQLTSIESSEIDIDVTKDAEVLQKQEKTVADMKQLCDWLESGGAILNKIRVWYFSENYRGIQLSQGCGIKELLLYVPRKFIITYQDATSCPVFKSFVESPQFSQLK